MSKQLSYTTASASTTQYDRQRELASPLRSFTPKAIMARPSELARLCDAYFRQLTPPPTPPTPQDPEPFQLPPDPPTPAGLALGLGFSSVAALLSAATSEAHPEESRHLLMSALTMIEDELTTKGLMDRVNTTFAKFLLSARLGLSEKSEVVTTNDTNIRVIVASAAPQTPSEQAEFNRLTAALQEQTDGELLSMGRATNTISAAAKDAAHEAKQANVVESLEDLI